MFPHGSYLAGHVAAWGASDPAGSDRGASIAWIAVHAITRSNTCLNYILSEMIAGLTFRHVDTSWASDLHQMKIAWSRSNGLRWSHVERFGASDFHQRTIFIGRPWGCVEELRDRAVIEAKMARDWRGLVAHRSASDRRSPNTTVDVRLRPDRGAIVARSWRKSRRKRSKSEAKLKQNMSRFVAELKPRLRPKESPSTTTANHLHDRLHHPQFGANFFFKNPCIPSFVLQLLIDSWRN